LKCAFSKPPDLLETRRYVLPQARTVFENYPTTSAVPGRAELVQRLKDHHATHGIGERFFTDAANQWAFSEAVKAAGLTPPTGQATHVLRHTFASHFIRNGRSILTLQKIVGHQSLTMTMRYAHVAPDHLIQATEFNPLAKPAL
jgi:site-specific recombinase XerD